MSLLVKLTDVIFKPRHEFNKNLEHIRKDPTACLYLYVSTADNSSIVNPAFWMMPPSLKRELLIFIILLKIYRLTV